MMSMRTALPALYPPLQRVLVLHVLSRLGGEADQGSPLTCRLSWAEGVYFIVLRQGLVVVQWHGVLSSLGVTVLF